MLMLYRIVFRWTGKALANHPTMTLAESVEYTRTKCLEKITFHLNASLGEFNKFELPILTISGIMEPINY